MHFSSDKLWKARKSSRAKVAALMDKRGYNMAQSTLQNWERGWSEPPATAVGILASIYKVPVGEFFTRSKPRAA